MFKCLAITALFATVTLGDTVSENVTQTPGSSLRTERSLYGMENIIENFPYQTSLGFRWFDFNLGYQYSHHCGGIIISKSWVLTAAHCIIRNDSRTDNVNIVKAGTTNQYDEPINNVHGVSLHEIALSIIHPLYKRVGSNQLPPYDIGLLLVKQPFVYDAIRQPIPLYRWDQKFLEGSIATVSGWGWMQPGGPHSHNLNTLQMPIIAKENCSKAQEYFVGEICAGDGLGYKASCIGDSGGPVTVTVPSPAGWTRYLVGVISGGPLGCAAPRRYSIFTDVAYFAIWIESQISERCILPM